MIDDKYGLLEAQQVPLYEELLRKHGKGIVLELGCGPRDPAEKARMVDFLIQMDGSDASREFFRDLSLPKNTIYVHGDVRQQPFSNNSIDAAIMVGIYGDCMPPKEQVQFRPSQEFPTIWEWLALSQNRLLSETYRVLRPSGKVIVSNSYSRTPYDIHARKFEEYFEILDVNLGKDRYFMFCQAKK